MKIKYPKSLLFYSRNTATDKKLEVDFSLVTLPGCIWRNMRYALAKEEVYYLFHFFNHCVYKFRWTILPLYWTFLKDY